MAPVDEKLRSLSIYLANVLLRVTLAPIMSPNFAISCLNKASWSDPVSDWLAIDNVGVGSVPVEVDSKPSALIGAG